MHNPANQQRLIELDVSLPIWERFFWVAPLVLVGTREPDGGHDLAPKHMATPIGWENYYGFVCTPRHHTYSNIRREASAAAALAAIQVLNTTSFRVSARRGTRRPAALVVARAAREGLQFTLPCVFAPPTGR